MRIDRAYSQAEMSSLAESNKPHRRRTKSVKSVDADASAPSTSTRLAKVLTARIATAKRRLLKGGVLREIEWGIPGERDIRGRRRFTYSMLDALIEDRPALDRSTIDTDRADNTVLTILDPLAILDSHVFRWGDPPHVYKVKAVDGLLKNAETGTRYASEITVIR